MDTNGRTEQHSSVHMDHTGLGSEVAAHSTASLWGAELSVLGELSER